MSQPMMTVPVQLPAETIARIERARGQQSRAAFIRGAVHATLAQDAVSPQLPTSGPSSEPTPPAAA